MSNTLLRQWTMLKSVPREPAKIGTAKLKRLLEQAGFQVSQRTIQRDLKRLAGVFPELRTDHNPDMAGWFWTRDCAVHDLPAIDPPMALTFKLAQSFLENLIPPSVMELLHPYLRASDQVLETLDQEGFRHWADKVAIVPRTQPLIPAPVEEAVVWTIHEALLRQRKFHGWYRPRNGEEREYEFKPYGLVYRDSVAYLVAAVWNYEDPLQYALHRFSRCELLEARFEPPESFDLRQYVASGAFEYPVGDGRSIHLVARFSAQAGHHLYETPLSEDQRIVKKRSGDLEIHATVKNTQQLRWWLLGFGNQVRVVRPAALKRELEALACPEGPRDTD